MLNTKSQKIFKFKKDNEGEKEFSYIDFVKHLSRGFGWPRLSTRKILHPVYFCLGAQRVISAVYSTPESLASSFASTTHIM